MQTYKVSQKQLNSLKELVNTDLPKINEMYPDEFNLNSDRFDHVDVKATQITFHDRGHNFGDGVIDVTFRVISK